MHGRPKKAPFFLFMVPSSFLNIARRVENKHSSSKMYVEFPIRISRRSLMYVHLRLLKILTHSFPSKMRFRKGARKIRYVILCRSTCEFRLCSFWRSRRALEKTCGHSDWRRYSRKRAVLTTPDVWGSITYFPRNSPAA